MIEVIQPGPLVSVQDAGRFGWRHAGVSPAGPMDAPAHRLANALVGNGLDAAALEFAGTGGLFRVTRTARIAVTGGRVRVQVGARTLAADEAHELAAGEDLRVGALSDALWGYIAVSGGIATPLVLGSRATHLRNGLGGLAGRALRGGDRLPLGPAVSAPCLVAPAIAPGTGAIRVVAGPQAARFSPDVRAAFLTCAFTVTARRDRMAMMLDGPPLPATGGHDIVSDAVVAGSIQVPGSGQPLVLMAEAQTTGGYPKIATVIGADIARLAQWPAGGRVRFRAITRDEAEEVWIAARRAERARLAALTVRADALSSGGLLALNLIGGVWGGETPGAQP